MKTRDPLNPGDAAFDKLDEKIRRALMEEGAIIPETIEEVRQAKARFKAQPVTLPPHLRNSSAIPESEDNEIPTYKTVTLSRKGQEAVCEITKVAHRKVGDVFVEAVVIAQFTRLQDPRFPLGHLRQNKMVYFAHRRADENVEEHFLKQPAGPYSPWAKYQGPEKIAMYNGYIQRAKVGNLVGFVVGHNIDKIDRYIPRYPVCAAVEWVFNKFRFRKNEQLELLATVDFAAFELVRNKKAITMENVKNVIATSKEWTAKLKREIFSDENINRALSELRELFPKTYA